jgi:hypothetical protein
MPQVAGLFILNGYNNGHQIKNSKEVEQIIRQETSPEVYLTNPDLVVKPPQPVQVLNQTKLSLLLPDINSATP